MEKSTAKYRKFINGLLILVINILTISSVYGAPSWSYMRSLRFTPMQSYFFTSTDNTYYLEIAGCRPEEVDFYVHDLPDGVSFVSSTKSSVVVKDEKGEDTRGTRLELTYRFSKNGTYLLPSMMVQVSGWSFYVAFERVSVFENPKLVQPVLSIEFENPDFNSKKKDPYQTGAGEHVKFTIYVRYAAQISRFDWEIPEDSLFTELKRYEIADNNYKSTEFTPEPIPVATFDWQPLFSKQYMLPTVSVNAIGYNGSEVELKYPSYVFDVQAREINETVVKPESVFAYAFTPPVEDVQSQSVKNVTKEQIKRVQELRQRERYALFSLPSIRKERRALEQSIGLGLRDDEHSKIIFLILVIVAILSIIGAIILYSFKKGRYGTLLVIIFCACTSFGIIQGIDLSKNYAIYQGGDIYPIPEEGISSSGLVIPLGSRVRVLYSVGQWAYIQCNDITGWIDNKTIYTIK